MPTSSLLRLAVPLLAAVAILGYLAGHHRASATTAGAAGKTPIAYGKSVLLEYPHSWRPVDARTAPAIPGVRITSPVLLAPGGDAASAGLLSGQIPGGGTSPLPNGLLAQLRGAPHTEVVDLLNAQAYRYSQLSVRGYDRVLYLYVIPNLDLVPNPGGSSTALACYAAAAASSYLRQCQRIVAGLTLVGHSASDLTPEAGYAGRLNQLIASLDGERLKLRARMRTRATPIALSHLASTLAERFAAAAKSLSVLEPPPAVGATQAALANSIEGARGAYEALAAAALAGSPSGYAAAQAHVAQAESGVDAALQSFALLGYSQA
jgi:hypothetical protein